MLLFHLVYLCPIFLWVLGARCVPRLQTSVARHPSHSQTASEKYRKWCTSRQFYADPIWSSSFMILLTCLAGWYLRPDVSSKVPFTAWFLLPVSWLHFGLFPPFSVFTPLHFPWLYIINHMSDHCYISFRTFFAILCTSCSLAVLT